MQTPLELSKNQHHSSHCKNEDITRPPNASLGIIHLFTTRLPENWKCGGHGTRTHVGT